MKNKKMVFLVLFVIFTLIFTFTLTSMAKPLLFAPAEFVDDYDEIYAYIENIEYIRYAAIMAVTITQSGYGRPLDTSETAAF